MHSHSTADRTAGGAGDDGWRIRRTGADLDRLGETESVFALGNGWVGWRGNLDEGTPYGMPGSYLNGFHEQRELTYPEDGYAFPQRADTVVSAQNAALVRLWVTGPVDVRGSGGASDGEPLDLRTGTLHEHERVLDLRAGVVERRTDWSSPAGHRVRVSSTRLVSLPRRPVAAVRYVVEAVDTPVDVRVCADLLANERVPERSDDPRAASVIHDPLTAEARRADGLDGVLVHRTDRSGQRVATAVAHQVSAPAGFATEADFVPDRFRLAVTGRLRPGDRLELTRYAAYECAPVGGVSAAELADLVAAEAHAARAEGFPGLLAAQRAALDAAWATADVVLDGDPELQQAVRFAVFHLLQAGRPDGDRTIPAKGLTGNGYDGHVLWDTEGYVLPVLTYLAPEVARSALRWRHAHLPEARERAAELRLAGAAFPWRTIGGRECSGYWPAGSAGLHVNADIADAVLHYVAATGDREFLAGPGVDLLVETARLWHRFGHWSDDGAFHLHGVTGPDEYTALVDDNLFTNLMARRNLRGAADAAERHPEAAARLGVDAAEIAGWRAAGDAMFVPYDRKRGVHQQAAGFTEQPEWDFANTSSDEYPLLLHYPYLELYRRQVIKQADLVLAMLRCAGEFTAAEKARNFAYYAARTVRDSSLSAAPQAVLAAEVGHLDLAYDLFAETALQDLADLGDKSADGLHLASLAGAWLVVAQGFGGLRDDAGVLSFDPRLPRRLRRVAFSLRWRGHRLRVTLTPEGARYELPDAGPGDAVELWHHGERLQVTGDAAVTRPLPPLPDPGPEPPSPPGRRPARR
ncbi:glycoside hydrolase family 65 protein [Micromonospora olivasterospora]|uniref:Alpha,alpha-trehalose phosphorylase n=1 Tax=Micromonospora olivasterospora TaxID=1880 RepID=A0A562I9M1_MICOL|nr:glycosyl hydrolase family 65 protein [Micromonospora olivasterospora]TWH67719.1 alpha,alpha-trehalose phosphorylase [Micromonospora olivasterospora]